MFEVSVILAVWIALNPKVEERSIVPFDVKIEVMFAYAYERSH